MDQQAQTQTQAQGGDAGEATSGSEASVQQTPTAEQLRADALARASGGDATAPAESTAPESSGDDGQSFARLAASYRQVEQQLAKERKDREQLAQRLARFDALKDPEKKFELAQELGLTYEEWTDHVLRQAGHKVDPDEYIDAKKLSPELRKKLEELDELKSEAQQRREYEQRQRQAEMNAADLAAARQFLSSGDTPIASALGGENHMVALWREKESAGEAPEAREVAREVESRFIAQVDKQLAALAATPAGKELLNKHLGLTSESGSATTATTSKPTVTTGNNEHAGGPRALSQELASDRGDGVDKTKLAAQELRSRGIEALRRASSGGR